jgi:DNA-binding transcriptional LysR family regulator
MYNRDIMITLRDLEIFVCVAEKGRITDAADFLHISQPTVSHVIALIEQTYSVRLFDRLSKKLYITETGAELLTYSRIVLSNFKKTEEYLIHAAGKMTIRAGASLTVGSIFMAPIISRFESLHPRINIEVYIDNTGKILNKIRDASLDVAVIEGYTDSGDLTVQDIYTDEMVLICGKNHPFASRKSVKPVDLEGMDCILREEGSGTREFLMRLTEERGIHIKEKWVCHSLESIVKIVAEGQGVSIVSEAQIHDNTDVVRIPVETGSMYRTFKTVLHKDKFVSKQLQSLLDEFTHDFGEIGFGRPLPPLTGTEKKK